jgi:hypothetical protein
MKFSHIKYIKHSNKTQEKFIPPTTLRVALHEVCVAVHVDVILHMRSISFFLFTRVLCQTEKVKFYISIILQKIVGFSVKPSLFFHYKLMYESLIQYCDYIGKFYTLPYRSNHCQNTYAIKTLQ